MPIYHALEARSADVQVREARRRVMRVVALLQVALAVCSFALLALDSSSDPLGEKMLRAVWNALNLVTTLGDFSGLDQRAMFFMMFTMVAFMILGGYAISSLTGIVSSAAMMTLRENRRMEHKLDGLADHIIVAGFGPVGRLVAAQVQQAGVQVVIVEHNEEMTTQASSLGYLVVHGDAGADPAALKGSRVEQARALVVTTDDPDRKLSITLMAHSCNPKLKISVTGANAPRGALLRHAGASKVVLIDELVASALVDELGKAGNL
jgi:voltage-gated potassium channel Kch